MKLRQLFSALCENSSSLNNDDTFSLSENTSCRYEETDIEFLTSYFLKGFNYKLLDEHMRFFFNISFNVFDILLHAWMSELPVEKEILSFGRKIYISCRDVSNLIEKENIAKKLITDRTDPDTRVVLNVVGKTRHEIHRMRELLRFNPDSSGGFTAVCEPDHFVLPCLGEYFNSRFGEIAWSITDKKRGMSLSRACGQKAKIIIFKENILSDNKKTDDWEELWKHYHKTINNEERNNPDLQKQLMPKRYWKYLPEK